MEEAVTTIALRTITFVYDERGGAIKDLKWKQKNFEDAVKETRNEENIEEFEANNIDEPPKWLRKLAEEAVYDVIEKSGKEIQRNLCVSSNLPTLAKTIQLIRGCFFFKILQKTLQDFQKLVTILPTLRAINCLL